MDEVSEQASRLIERAQSGEEREVLAEAERLLREPTGDLVDGAPDIHFARAIALTVIGDGAVAIAAADLMIASCEREVSPGWRTCALTLRAGERLRLGEQSAAQHDLDAVLRDLVDAEATIRTGGVRDLRLASHAHTGVALGYHQLRLYELAVPHYEEAYDLSTRYGVEGPELSMWLLNLTRLHLDWALELYRVGQDDAALRHSHQAEDFATSAAETASGPERERWHDMGRLLAACARADGDDPGRAAAEISTYATNVELHHMEVEFSGVAPFHAVALSRSGRKDEALVVIEKAVAGLSANTPWTAVAAATHTRAVLLAQSGSSKARAALAYGDTLAQALWRQRLRTLHVATTMQSYENLRVEHELVSQSARTDPLTGIANRRAFDAAVESLHDLQGADRPVAVLVVDLDRFKLINDTRGHEAGDEVLRQVALALSTNLRDGDLVAPLGGDEFAALLPGAGVDAAQRIAERMVRAVDTIEHCTATASIGLASGPSWMVRDSVGRADQAMYDAKRRGGNQVSRGA